MKVSLNYFSRVLQVLHNYLLVLSAGKGEPIKGEVSVKGEIEIMDIVLEKKEGQSLGFTVCRGNGIIDGIRNIHIERH